MSPDILIVPTQTTKGWKYRWNPSEPRHINSTCVAVWGNWTQHNTTVLYTCIQQLFMHVESMITYNIHVNYIWYGHSPNWAPLPEMSTPANRALHPQLYRPPDRVSSGNILILRTRASLCNYIVLRTEFPSGNIIILRTGPPSGTISSSGPSFPPGI